MFDSLDFAEVDEREGSKRKKNGNLGKYSEEESGSTVATFPIFKRKKGRDVGLLHEDSCYAQFSGERLFEAQSCDKDFQAQAENDMKAHVSSPPYDPPLNKLQLKKRNKKMKKMIEEDKVVHGCRDKFNSDSPCIDSVRTCMHACLQEVTEARNQFIKWMREEIQNFLFRQTLTSGLQITFSGPENAYGNPEVAAANLSFESGGRSTDLSFEGHDYTFREHNFGTKPESVKLGDSFPDFAGMRFGRKNVGAEPKGTSFGGECGSNRGAHMEVQPSGSLEEMRFTAQRSQISALNWGDDANGIAGPSIGTGGGSSVHQLSQGSNYAAENLKSAHSHSLKNLFSLHFENNLNFGKVHGPTGSGLQNPITLGMMWNVMHHHHHHNNMLGLSNHTSGMANKSGNEMFFRNNMVYENHIPSIASVSLGMHLPVGLQTTSSPAGTAQSFVSIPTATEMQSPVSLPSFINLGMAGLMGSTFNGQFIQTPTISECNGLDKSTIGREPMISASEKKTSQISLQQIKGLKGMVWPYRQKW